MDRCARVLQTASLAIDAEDLDIVRVLVGHEHELVVDEEVAWGLATSRLMTDDLERSMDCEIDAEHHGDGVVEAVGCVQELAAARDVDAGAQNGRAVGSFGQRRQALDRLWLDRAGLLVERVHVDHVYQLVHDVHGVDARVHCHVAWTGARYGHDVLGRLYKCLVFRVQCELDHAIAPQIRHEQRRSHSVHRWCPHGAVRVRRFLAVRHRETRAFECMYVRGLSQRSVLVDGDQCHAAAHIVGRGQEVTVRAQREMTRERALVLHAVEEPELAGFLWVSRKGRDVAGLLAGVSLGRLVALVDRVQGFVRDREECRVDTDAVGRDSQLLKRAVGRLELEGVDALALAVRHVTLAARVRAHKQRQCGHVVFFLSS